MNNSRVIGNPYAAYKQSAVDTATPEKLLLMLFDGGIKFLHQAKVSLEEKKYSESHTYLVKVQDIISELIRTLDREKGGEIAENLNRLYEFYLGEVIEANIKKDIERLNPVLEFFQTFRETWAEAAKKVRIGA